MIDFKCAACDKEESAIGAAPNEWIGNPFAEEGKSDVYVCTQCVKNNTPEELQLLV